MNKKGYGNKARRNLIAVLLAVCALLIGILVIILKENAREAVQRPTPVPTETALPPLPEASPEIVSTESALYSYENMQSDLEALKTQYPELLSLTALAKTADGREIVDAVVGNPKADTQIVIQASIHGREYINTLLAMKQIEALLRGYQHESYQNVSYHEILQSACFHILPMSNPDGVAISQFGVNAIASDELKDKLLACYQREGSDESQDDYWVNWKANGRGVDLNRNFDIGWSSFEGSENPSSEKYKGDAPASEIETQAILKLAEECGASCVISYHSYGNIVYWDYDANGVIRRKDKALADVAEAVTGYPKESSAQSATDSAGCSDYFALEKAIPAVTIENGANACPVPIEDFGAIWQANAELLPALALHFTHNASEALSDEVINTATASAAPAGTTDERALPLSGKIIGVDPGHQKQGNSDKEPNAPGSSVMKAKAAWGTSGKASGKEEYEINLEVGLLLKALLEEQGAVVIMTRETHDVDISNIERAKIFNEAKTDYAVRLHCNGTDNAAAHGAFVIIPTSNPYLEDCKRAGDLLIDSFCGETGAKNMGIMPMSDQTGLNWCERMVIGIEMGHMSNAEEDLLLADKAYQQKMAKGILNGIISYFNTNEDS